MELCQERTYVKLYPRIFLLSLVCYLLFIFPFAAYQRSRPLQIKLGYFPEAKAVSLVAADQKYTVATWATLKVLLYFGALIEKAKGETLYASEPDFAGMFKILQTAVRLDPYDMDAYYFAQAAFTWETGHFKEVNDLLEYGMKYRTWDYQLPFFVGFNYGYFLHDYRNAALYMGKAAEIAKEQQFATLAARYFYEAGEDDLAIRFIDYMKKSAKDDNEKKLYEVRRKALVGVKTIKAAVRAFRKDHGRNPSGLRELVSAGYLTKLPQDPYGGQFYLEPDGMVRSTSKFAFIGGASSPRPGK
jgi:hypothetical protein